MGSTSPRLSILVLEDNVLLVPLLQEALLTAGYDVLTATGVEEALRLLQTKPVHGAILDINIGNDLSFPVAELLERRHIPYLFASAADPAIVPHEYAARLKLEKPYRVRNVVESLSRLLVESPIGTTDAKR